MISGRTIRRSCSECGTEFIITHEFQQYLEQNGLKFPKRCKSCRVRRKVDVTTIECKECGDKFDITSNESKFYAERGLKEPKRCSKCRKSARNG